MLGIIIKKSGSKKYLKALFVLTVIVIIVGLSL